MAAAWMVGVRRLGDTILRRNLLLGQETDVFSRAWLQEQARFHSFLAVVGSHVAGIQVEVQALGEVHL